MPSPSLGYSDWASTVRSPALARAASQIKALEAAHAKSRTRSASYRQVRRPVPSGRVSGAPTSVLSMIMTGSRLWRASASRSRCVSVSTSSGFWRRPVPPTIMLRGTVMLTLKVPYSR